MANTSVKLIAQNKKAWHEYFVEDTLEAGLVLCGTEVKSVRLGKVNLKDSYLFIKDGEAFVRGMHISPYEMGNIFNVDPLRDRKLLLHKKEITKLFARIKQDGYALIPLKLYLSRGLVKMELGVCRGKKLYDKRQADAERSAKRDIERTLRSRMR